MGKVDFWPPSHHIALKPVKRFWWILKLLNYFLGTTPDAKSHFSPAMQVIWANSQFATVLVYFSFVFFSMSRRCVFWRVKNQFKYLDPLFSQKMCHCGNISFVTYKIFASITMGGPLPNAVWWLGNLVMLCILDSVVMCVFTCSEIADSVLLNNYSSDLLIGSLAGSTSGIMGLPGTGSIGGPSGGSTVSGSATGPPQYDISFVFQDNNRLAKNAKRSYESQVCHVGNNQSNSSWDKRDISN